MANNITPKSSYERAAAQVQAKRAAERATVISNVQPKTSASKRARLNFIPDSDTLSSLIDQALSALSRGVRWARGSIVNLIV
jgi:hypothetical protein